MVLPEFISNEISRKNTSLGANKAFGDMCIELTSELLNERYEQVIKSIKERYGYIPTIDEAQTKLSKLINKTIEIEKPLRSQLETLCESIVSKTLGIPQETILLNCELVDEIKPYKELRIVPESPEYTFKKTSESLIDANDEILKRRLINSLVQGISYLLMTATYDSGNIKEWSNELTGLYTEAIYLNDYLLFSKEEKISDKNPMLGAYVETHLGKFDEKTVIDSQGLIYPLLLQETYRGFFELFASHGLPDDVNDAKYIMRRADFTMAEAWDIRIGVPMWQRIDKMIPDNVEPSIYPYIFSSIVQENLPEFNRTIFDCLTHVEGRLDWFKNIVNTVEHDKEYQLFKQDIEKFNLEKCLVTDENNEEDNIID